MKDDWGLFGLLCPVAVINEDEDEEYPSERCEGRIGFRTWSSWPDGRVHGRVECEHGHDAQAMERDGVRDLDGVPLGF